VRQTKQVALFGIGKAGAGFAQQVGQGAIYFFGNNVGVLLFRSFFGRHHSDIYIG
jgi:hypothetical protein